MSEPMTWRMFKTNYRIKGTRCTICGRIYFPPKSFCDREGRKSSVEDIYLGERMWKIYSGGVSREPTAKFSYLGSILSVYISLEEDQRVLIAGRLTDFLPPKEEVHMDEYIGKEVVPRFRKAYDDGIIQYSRLQFSLLDDYYRSHLSIEHEPVLRREKRSEKVGVIGYSTYIPKYRIKVQEVAKAYDKNPNLYEGVVKEKAVPFLDEDTRTLTVESAERAIFSAGVYSGEIDVVAVGTESNPYAVYPISVTVVDACGINQYANSYDTRFACKAATSQIALMCGAIETGLYRNALLIGSDNSQAEPGDALDYSVGTGSAALVLGGEGVIATLEHTAHYSSDIPDFYRRSGDKYPSHGQRFTGEQAYFKHIVNAGKALMEKADLKPSDFDYFVAHQPNMKFPRKVARTLGFDKNQFEQGNAVDYIGNLYAGSSLAGLCAILDIAKPGQRILMVSYGSGAGSDAYSFLVTEEIEEKRARTIGLRDQIFNPKKEYVNYDFYRRAKEM